MTNNKFCIAQINTTVGDISGNTERILQAVDHAKKHSADCIVFPELSLCGYPPEDLLHQDGLFEEMANAMQKICRVATKIHIILGFAEKHQNQIYNSAAILYNQKIQHLYQKQALPNYGVFDEKRYFSEGTEQTIFELNKQKIAVLICEDIWQPNIAKKAKEQGAELVITINASPFSLNKQHQRESVLSNRTREVGLPVLYVNCVGGQDELVFDGGSMQFDANGHKTYQATWFKESQDIISLHPDSRLTLAPEPSPEEKIYRALVLGVRDYCWKNKFDRVIIGLSGGIDSALTLAIAFDALGPEAITTVAMPSQYTAEISELDAGEMANSLGIRHHSIAISDITSTIHQALDGLVRIDQGICEQNIQARVRGTLLMAISNDSGGLLLSTGNKSELSVGYTTLYGDMAGGFCVLKDVNKTQVYALANYRNSINPCIPQRIIQRPPSAELAPDQKDEDNLPPYAVLDPILSELIEKDKSPKDLYSCYPKAAVDQATKLIFKNEYKRRQAAPGIKISEKAFGRDRRYPITQQLHD